MKEQGPIKKRHLPEEDSSVDAVEEGSLKSPSFLRQPEEEQGLDIQHELFVLSPFLPFPSSEPRLG